MITATSGILYSLGIEEDLGYAMYCQRHFLDPLLPGDGECVSCAGGAATLVWRTGGPLALEAHAELLSMENETSMD